METSGAEHHEEFICELQSHPEQEWLEFKKDNADPQMIGEYISALSNAATLSDQQNAFMLWGIDDQNIYSPIPHSTPEQRKRVGNSSNPG